MNTSQPHNCGIETHNLFSPMGLFNHFDINSGDFTNVYCTLSLHNTQINVSVLYKSAVFTQIEAFRVGTTDNAA